MSEAAKAILTKALELPIEDQQWLTDRLIAETETDDDDAEWQAKLERRLDDVEKHPERLIDGEQVMREVDEMLAAKRVARS